jgi:hypothetical protein
MSATGPIAAETHSSHYAAYAPRGFPTPTRLRPVLSRLPEVAGTWPVDQVLGESSCL